MVGAAFHFYGVIGGALYAYAVAGGAGSEVCEFHLGEGRVGEECGGERVAGGFGGEGDEVFVGAEGGVEDGGVGKVGAGGEVSV